MRRRGLCWRWCQCRYWLTASRAGHLITWRLSLAHAIRQDPLAHSRKLTQRRLRSLPHEPPHSPSGARAVQHITTTANATAYAQPMWRRRAVITAHYHHPQESRSIGNPSTTCSRGFKPTHRRGSKVAPDQHPPNITCAYEHDQPQHRYEHQHEHPAKPIRTPIPKLQRINHRLSLEGWEQKEIQSRQSS